MEANRILKANPKIAGTPCGWCQNPLALGDDASVCTTCERPHHQGCWGQQAGCATQGCINAPLRQLAPEVMAAPPGRALPPGTMSCPHCRETIAQMAQMCPFCNAITSPDGLYHGPKINAPGAVQSLVYGIIGLFLCNIILGPVAIIKANKAKEAMAGDPRLGGHGLATAGQVLGVIDIVLFVIYLMIKASAK